jgi:hypothetical protein
VKAWLRVRPASSAPELFLNARAQAMTRDGFEYILAKHVGIECQRKTIVYLGFTAERPVDGSRSVPHRGPPPHRLSLSATRWSEHLSTHMTTACRVTIWRTPLRPYTLARPDKAFWRPLINLIELDLDQLIVRRALGGGLCNVS